MLSGFLSHSHRIAQLQPSPTIYFVPKQSDLLTFKATNQATIEQLQICTEKVRILRLKNTYRGICLMHSITFGNYIEWAEC